MATEVAPSRETQPRLSGAFVGESGRDCEGCGNLAARFRTIVSRQPFASTDGPLTLAASRISPPGGRFATKGASASAGAPHLSVWEGKHHDLVRNRGLGCLHLLVSVMRKPIPDAESPIAGFVTAAIAGSVLYGLPLWLLAWLIN
jgi:hypothetical protein